MSTENEDQSETEEQQDSPTIAKDAPADPSEWSVEDFENQDLDQAHKEFDPVLEYRGVYFKLMEPDDEDIADILAMRFEDEVGDGDEDVDTNRALCEKFVEAPDIDDEFWEGLGAAGRNGLPIKIGDRLGIGDWVDF